MTIAIQRRLGALLCGTMLAAPGYALARQAQAPADQMIEEVVVTASRAAQPGVIAPTPTTTLGAQDLKNSGLTNIADLLNTQSPAFRASTTPSASVRVTGGGGNTLNLRGLGASRTLVLVDGRRFVATGPTGAVNINVIPQALIDRTEVVTGGASAAWGSDAVAGVVNLVFRKKLEGVQGEVRYGGTDKGDNDGYTASLAYGHGYAGDRGQLMIAGEIGENNGVKRQSDRDWGREGWQILANPAATPTNGLPARLVARDVHINAATPGGVIVSPTGLIPGGRLEFLPDGATAVLQAGSVNGASAQVGGGGINASLANTLVIPEKRANLYGRTTFDFNDSVTGFAELSYAQSKTQFGVSPSFDLGSLTIKRDNAFLPAAIRTTMQNAGIADFKMGRINYDFGLMNSIIEDKVVRAVVGLEGRVGGWSWDAYVTQGRTKDVQSVNNDRITSRFNASIDSLVDPVTGQAVCRNPAGGCVPVNLFGAGSPSRAALDYINGVSRWDVTMEQTVVAANLRGEPFSTWAGPVSVAAGAEYRNEKTTFATDALSQAGAFFTHSAKNYAGRIEVGEVYAETIAPVLRDLPLAHALDLNAAVRFTDYSTSGKVTTWKLGGVYEPVAGIRLRATRSKDIRAPNAQELFSAGQSSFTTLIDPKLGGSATVQVFGGGNPNLSEERAKTNTLGVTFAPAWAPGLSASVDWFDIKLGDAIGSLAAQTIVNRCQAGENALCAFVQRNPSTQALTAVTASVVNVSAVTTRGEDIEIGYRLPLSRVSEALPGTATFRLLASHVDELVTSDGVTRKDAAGSLGPTNALGGVPKWRYSVTGTYETGPLNLYLAGRYVGGGEWDKDFGPADIDNNDVKSAFYVDATVRYQLIRDEDRSLALFASVRNLFDKDPPVVPSPDFNGPPTNSVLFDVIGRYFSAGVTFRY